jgi:hypothetical protein
VIWSFTTFWLMFLSVKEEHPMHSEPVVFWMWVAATVYFAAICALRSIEEPEDE